MWIFTVTNARKKMRMFIICGIIFIALFLGILSLRPGTVQTGADEYLTAQPYQPTAAGQNSLERHLSDWLKNFSDQQE